MTTEKYIQGSVWWFYRHHGAEGITWGKHPCVIISSTCWNSKSNSVVVVPCTSGEVQGALKFPKLELVKSEGNFLPTQVTTIPKSWLGEYLGVLDTQTLFAVVKAVARLTAMPASAAGSLTSDEKGGEIITESSEAASSDPKPLISSRRRIVFADSRPKYQKRFRQSFETRWDRKKRADLLIDYSTLPIEEVLQKWHFKDDAELIRTIVKIRSMNDNAQQENFSIQSRYSG